MASASLKCASLFFFNYFRFFNKKIMYFIINLCDILISNKRGGEFKGNLSFVPKKTIRLYR